RLRTAVGHFGSEARLIFSRGSQVWRMVPRPLRRSFLLATVVMAAGSFAAIGIPVLLGGLIDDIQVGATPPLAQAHLFPPALLALASIDGLIFVREGLNVYRRYLVENPCTRIEKHLNVLVVGHLLRTELSHLTHEKVGAVHGRVCRSIEGFNRFL